MSEGIAPTLPRDSQRQIRWDMLRRAGGIPEFPDRMHTALQEMETGRMQILEALVRRANARQPQAGTVNVQWVLEVLQEHLILQTQLLPTALFA